MDEDRTTPVEGREVSPADHESDRPLELHIVSKDGVDAMAWQVADERISERTQSTVNLEGLSQVDADATGIRKFGQRFKQVAHLAARKVGHAVTNPSETWNQVWTGNIMREHVRRNEHDNVVREMREARGGLGSVMAPKGVNEAAAQAEDQSLIQRFSHELDRSVLHHGEQKTNISENTEYQAVEQEIKGLVRELVAGNFADDASFIEARNRVLDRVSREHPEIVANSMMYAENLRQVANRVRESADETGASTDRLIDDMKVYVDIARTGVRGEIQHDRLERVAGALRGRSTDILVNEGVVATAASIAMSVSKVFGRKLTSSTLRIGAVGAGAGLWAAGRERRAFHQEYRQHSRQAAMGETFEGARRAEIEQARIETVSANHLTDTLNSNIFVNGNPAEGIRDDVDQESFNTALLALAQARITTNASDAYNMDLISYTSAETIESERLALDIAIAEAQIALQRIAAANPDLEVNIGNGDTSVENAVNGLHMLIHENMSTDIQGSVDTFKEVRRMRAFKAARNAMVFGVAIGTIVEEVSSLVNPAQQGLIESAFNGNKGATSESLLNGIIDNPFAEKSGSGSGNILNADEIARFESTHDQSTGWITKTNGLPEGYEFEIDSENHVMHLVDHKGNTIVEDIDIDEARRFTDAGIAQLEEAGIKVNKEIMTFDTTETITKTVTDAEFVNNHPELVTNVHRELWYGNDTPAPIFDQNELRTHWVGNGVDAEGYKLSMGAMTEDGSWWGEESAAAHALAEQGKLKYFLSASDGTQSTPFVFDINPENGQILIPHDHPAAALFGTDENGHAVLKGRFGEVAEVRGVNQYGVTEIRPLATHVGDGMPSLNDTITTGGKIDGAVYDLEFEAPIPIEAPSANGLPPDGLFMPFVPRAGLENKKDDNPNVYPPYGYGYGYGYGGVGGGYGIHTPEQIENLVNETIPILREDPQAIVPIDKATSWYSDLLDNHYGKEYGDRLRDEIKSSSVLNSVDNNTKAILTIPVEAITEGDNIYKTLALYAKMSDEELASTKIILHLNHLGSKVKGREEQNRIDFTKSEIARALGDFPRLQVHMLESTWTDQQLAEGGGLVGYAVRKMYDMAILVSDEAAKAGRIDPDHEIVMIRNDADPNGIYRNYLANMVKAVNRPDRDGAVGKFKWGIEQSGDLPGLAFATKIMSGLANIAARSVQDTNYGWMGTSGANTSVRISTLAGVGSIGFDSFTGAGSDDQMLGRRIRAVRHPDEPANKSLRKGYEGVSTAPGYTPSWARLTSPGDGTTVGGATGSTIDTDASRLKRAYTEGRPIADAWLDYDQGGARPRGEGLNDSAVESLEDDPDGVLNRIEFQVNSLVHLWGYAPWQLDTVLKHYVNSKPGEGPLYEMYTDSKDQYSFRFTEEGRRVIAKRLMYDNKGRKDPIGSRRMRTVYGKPGNGKTFPEGRTPILISANR